MLVSSFPFNVWERRPSTSAPTPLIKKTKNEVNSPFLHTPMQVEFYQNNQQKY